MSTIDITGSFGSEHVYFLGEIHETLVSSSIPGVMTVNTIRVPANQWEMNEACSLSWIKKNLIKFDYPITSGVIERAHGTRQRLLFSETRPCYRSGSYDSKATTTSDRPVQKKSKKCNCPQRMVNEAVYNEVQNLKSEKYAAQRRMQTLKKDISHTRFEKFIRNEAINFRNKKSVLGDQQKHSIKRKERCIGKAEHMVLSGKNIAGDFTFSGTDNGLVTLSKTVPFSLDRFNYHVALYNTYAPLADDTQDDHQRINNLLPIPFLSLGSSFKVNADDIDLGGGYRRQCRI